MEKAGGTQKRGTEERETVRIDVFRTENGLKFTPEIGGGSRREWGVSGRNQDGFGTRLEGHRYV